MIKEHVLVILLGTSQFGTGPTIVSGFSSEMLCQVAGEKLAVVLREMNHSAKTTFNCVEITKSDSKIINTDNTGKPENNKM
jgi:hypothetical protein